MSSGRSLAPWLLSSISRTVSVGNGRQKQQIESRAHNEGFNTTEAGKECLMTRGGQVPFATQSASAMGPWPLQAYWWSLCPLSSPAEAAAS